MTSMVRFERVWRERAAEAVLIRSGARGLERPLKGIATERLLMAGTLSSRLGPTAVLGRDCQISKRQLSASVTNR